MWSLDDSSMHACMRRSSPGLRPSPTGGPEPGHALPRPHLSTSVARGPCPGLLHGLISKTAIAEWRQRHAGSFFGSRIDTIVNRTFRITITRSSVQRRGRPAARSGPRAYIGSPFRDSKPSAQREGWGSVQHSVANQNPDLVADSRQHALHATEGRTTSGSD